MIQNETVVMRKIKFFYNFAIFNQNFYLINTCYLSISLAITTATRKFSITIYKYLSRQFNIDK